MFSASAKPRNAPENTTLCFGMGASCESSSSDRNRHELVKQANLQKGKNCALVDRRRKTSAIVLLSGSLTSRAYLPPAALPHPPPPGVSTWMTSLISA